MKSTEIKEASKEITSSGSFVGRDMMIHNVYTPSIERLSKTDPSKVQEIVASQIELLSIYHNLVLDQARRSFRWALIAAGIGFGFFLASVAFLLFQQAQNTAVISLISGALIEVISGINFFLYGKTSAQLAEFQTRLDKTQRFLLANSVCEGLNEEFKQKSRSNLVRAIAGINSPMRSEKTERNTT